MVLGEECANPKPYPDPYQEGLKAFGVKPEETIVCEDSPSGELPPPLLCSCQWLQGSEQHEMDILQRHRASSSRFLHTCWCASSAAGVLRRARRDEKDLAGSHCSRCTSA